jgi:hypothetical protein
VTRYEGKHLTAVWPDEAERGYAAGCVLLLATFVLGLLLGAILALWLAGPQPAPTTTPRPGASETGWTVAWRSARSVSEIPAPASASSARPPVHPAIPQVAYAVRIVHKRLGATVTGIASHMGHTEPLGYLALPVGRSRRATICGPLACVTRVSTDAGPSKAMQRQGRVADLSIYDFATICGDPGMGLCHVRVTYR